MHLEDLALATRDALLLIDTTVGADLNLKLVQDDGRRACIGLGDLLNGRLELHPDADGERILYASVNDVIEWGWRIAPQAPATPTEAPEIVARSDLEGFGRAHLDSEIACSIALRLVNSEPADATIIIKFLLAPTLSINLGFRLDPCIERVGDQFLDAAITGLAKRWIARNRDVLRAVCRGEHNLAWDILDIELEDGNTWKEIVPDMHRPQRR